MWRPQIGELAEQIVVRTYFVSRHPPICEDRKEDIDGIVSECSAIVREGRRALGIVGQDIRQQCPCHPPRFLGRITTCVLQRVREDGNETGIIRRLTAEVGSVFRTGKEDSLLRPRAPVRLNPFPARAVQRASPQAQVLEPQCGIWYFQRDAAYVFVGKEIVAGEL
jgi:hypothetical protein